MLTACFLFDVLGWHFRHSDKEPPNGWVDDGIREAVLDRRIQSG